MVDQELGEVLIDGSEFIAPDDEGPVVDGFRLRIVNDLLVRVDQDRSGWTETSASNWELNISDAPTVNKTILAADLDIRFFDAIVDTSISGLGGRKTPVNFEVWDVTANQKMEFRFNDRDNDQAVSVGDEIRPVVFGDGGVQLSVWQIRFDAPDGMATSPREGDLIEIRVTKPFRNRRRVSVKDKRSVCRSRTCPLTA